MQRVEQAIGPRFGGAERPLLVSVRSGARVSMPGMMDTVLNLCLNDDTIVGLEASSGDARLAWPPADIPVNWGIAVNLQAMVFGYAGTDCAVKLVLIDNRY